MARLVNKLYPDPSKARSHDKGSEFFFIQPIKAAGKKFNVHYLKPSALYFNMALKSEKKASELLKEIQRKIHQSSDDLHLLEEEKFALFMNQALNLTVWGYAAIEAMANSHIESKYEESKIEVALNECLREKLQVILPDICKKHKLSKKLFNRFKQIEEARDKIIHPRKRDYYDADKWENVIFYDFLNGGFHGTAQCVKDIIDHFKSKIPSGPVTFHNVQRGMAAKPPVVNLSLN